MDDKKVLWFYVLNNQQQGPVDEGTIQTLVQNNSVNANTLVWQEGMPAWVPLQSTSLQAIVPVRSMPPVMPPAVQYGAQAMPQAVVDANSLNQMFLWFWILMAASVPLSIIVIGFFTAIAAAVLFYILLYRYWQVIQDGNVRTTPGKAIGYSFIPFFNFYWIFPSIYGLAQDMNRYCRERAIPAPVVSEQVALWYCILCLGSAIPYLNFLTGIGSFVLMIVLLNGLTKTSVAIINSRNMR